LFKHYGLQQTVHTSAVFIVLLLVPWRQPHRRSGLVTLPSVGAVP